MYSSHSNKIRKRIDNAVVRLEYYDIGFVQVVTYYQLVNLMGRYYFYTVGSYFGITFWDVDEVFGR